MKRLKLILRSLILVVTVLVALSFALPTERYFEIAKNLNIFATLFKEVNAHYVDEVEPDKLIKTGIDAMLESLDPYTNYIPEDQIESFRTLTTGQYGGIGSLIGDINGRIVVTMPYEGFAAQKAGLRIGDEIIAINGVVVEGKGTGQISKLLKGQANTPVEIKVRRYGESEDLVFKFQRERIKVDNIQYSGILESTVGYIKLTDFTSGAGKEVNNAIDDLKKQGAKQIILDLRNNPGGLLNEAVNVSNAFVSKGSEIVSTKGKIKEWNKVYKALNNSKDTKIPLVVLVNGGSASASEIVAGVIQDYDRGVLIGRRSFGKGLVQTTRPLSYNSQLKVTTAKYYIPSGRCIQAIDYSIKNSNGSVGAIPDSLKAAFKTKSGRTVYDGGGLNPDIEITPKYYAPITVSLINKGLIFDYATEYAYKNNDISSAKTFQMSDSDYNDFKVWLRDKDYDYTTQVEATIDQLIKTSKKEKYFESIEKQIGTLKSGVMHNKEADVENFSEEIKEILEREIVSRYYFSKGEVEATFDDDEDIQKAIQVLKDSQNYKRLLSK
ncbi:MAG: S41 family peptidase [Bacteroidota bacterium]